MAHSKCIAATCWPYKIGHTPVQRVCECVGVLLVSSSTILPRCYTELRWAWKASYVDHGQRVTPFSATGKAWDLRSALMHLIDAVLQLCSANVLICAIVAIARP